MFDQNIACFGFNTNSLYIFPWSSTERCYLIITPTLPTIMVLINFTISATETKSFWSSWFNACPNTISFIHEHILAYSKIFLIFFFQPPTHLPFYFCVNVLRRIPYSTLPHFRIVCVLPLLSLSLYVHVYVGCWQEHNKQRE